MLHPLRVVAAQRKLGVIGAAFVIADSVGAATLVTSCCRLDRGLCGLDQVLDLERLDPCGVEDLALVLERDAGNAFAQRTNRESVFKVGLLSNRFLLLGIGVEMVLIMVLIYVQPFQRIFQHGPLGFTDWLFLLALIPLLFVADEIRKFVVRWLDTRTSSGADAAHAQREGMRP